MTTLRPRVIPCMQLQGRSLVKTRRFRDPVYLGDPVNAMRIFNDKGADEVIVVDITATARGQRPDFGFVDEFAAECFMPLAYGGGITTLEDMYRLFQIGIEKAVVNSAAPDGDLIERAAREFGSQSVVVSMDVKKGLLGGYQVHTHSATRATGMDPVAYARRFESQGAGELFINFVDLDGTMSGYNCPVLDEVSRAVSVPVIGCGGAGSLDDLRRAFAATRVAALAAGSIFVLHGKHRAPLISYPDPEEIESLRN